MRSQVPYGHAVYVCGWIQGIPPGAHKAIEWARGEARNLACLANEFIEGELIPYFEKLDKEMEAAFARLTPTPKKTAKTYGENIEEFRRVYCPVYMKGGGKFNFTFPPQQSAPKKARITPVAMMVKGEKPPKPTYDHVTPPSLIEYEQEESNELAAQGKAKLIITPPDSLLKPQYLPPALRAQHRFTARMCWEQRLAKGEPFYKVCKSHDNQFKYILEKRKETVGGL